MKHFRQSMWMLEMCRSVSAVCVVDSQGPLRVQVTLAMADVGCTMKLQGGAQ